MIWNSAERSLSSSRNSPSTLRLTELASTLSGLDETPRDERRTETLLRLRCDGASTRCLRALMTDAMTLTDLDRRHDCHG